MTSSGWCVFLNGSPAAFKAPEPVPPGYVVTALAHSRLNLTKRQVDVPDHHDGLDTAFDLYGVKPKGFGVTSSIL